MLEDAKFTLQELEQALATGHLGSSSISADDAVRSIINGMGELRGELEQAGELIMKLEKRIRILEQSQPAQG